MGIRSCTVASVPQNIYISSLKHGKTGCEKKRLNFYNTKLETMEFKCSSFSNRSKNANIIDLNSG